MARIREVPVPDEVLEKFSGPYVRADKVALLRTYLAAGGTWPPAAVAERILDEVLGLQAS